MLGKKETSSWHVGVSIIFMVLGFGMVIWTFIRGASFIEAEKKIVEYAKECRLIDGEVRVVYTQRVNNTGKHAVDYQLYSGLIAYLNEQGEEAFFESNGYKKKLKVGQEIKLICKRDDLKSMDIAYFDIYTQRYAPMQMHRSWIMPIAILIFGGIGALFIIAGTSFFKETDISEKTRKEYPPDKEFRLNQAKKLTGFLTVVLYIFIMLLYINSVGIINPFTAYWTIAVVDDGRFYELRDEDGKIHEKYEYDCCFTTKQGEELIGIVVAEAGELEEGDTIEVLCYDGMNLERNLHTRESIFSGLTVFILPSISLVVYLFYKIQYSYFTGKCRKNLL